MPIVGDEARIEHRFAPVDDRSRVVAASRAREATEQKRQLESVSARIAKAITGFFRATAGSEFHADQLREYVEIHCGRVAPGSADRVMRDLRQRGVIAYEVVNRSQSLYRAKGVA
jgi:hypothetical protein